MDEKLTENEMKLKSKESENQELYSKLAVLQNQLSEAEENRKQLEAENKQLKFELKTVTTKLDHNDVSEIITKYNESKADYKLISNQLDLLEDDASDLVCENKVMLVEIESLQKTITEVTQINKDKNDIVEKANKELYELQQLVSLLEFVVEETSTQNLALQMKCNELYSKQGKTSKQIRQEENDSTNIVPNRKTFSPKTKKTEEAVCKQAVDSNSETANDNINVENRELVVNKPHCAVYLGLFMKLGRFPCKCGKDFGSKEDLKDHILNENRKAVCCSDCGRKFASNDEMQRHIDSFHKELKIPKSYHKF